MPSDVAVLRNLTFTPAGAGSPTDLQDLPRVFGEIDEGGPGQPAELRGAGFTVIPTADGLIPRNRRLSRLIVLITGSVSFDPAITDPDDQLADVADAKAELLALFTPLGDDEGELRVDDEAGRTWALMCRPEPMVWPANPPDPLWQTWSVRLVAYTAPAWVPVS